MCKATLGKAENDSTCNSLLGLLRQLAHSLAPEALLLGVADCRAAQRVQQMDSTGGCFFITAVIGR